MSLPPYSTARVEVVRYPDGETEDVLAVEEPLEIRIGGTPVAVTMRTPGHDEELAVGFALSEGLQPAGARLPDDLAANTIELDAPGFDPAGSRAASTRPRPAGSAARARSRRSPSRRLASKATFACPRRSSRASPIGCARSSMHSRRPGACTPPASSTGAAPCSACARTSGGTTRMDKVIGWAFGGGLLPLARAVLCVSGRLSFELVQKAAVAGCPVLVAVGAPSSLAVQLAQDRGVTLCGFVRGGRLNIYTEQWRVER